MIKVSLGHLWFTPGRLIEVPYGSNIMLLSFMCLNFWKLHIFTKWLETLHIWPNQLSLIKNRSLEFLAHIMVVLQSQQDFTYLAFKGFLCFNFLDLAVHDIASKSFETFHTSPNNCLLMTKLSLYHFWFSPGRLLEVPYGSNILGLSLMCLNFWKYANIHQMAWNFAQLTDSAVVDNKP